MSKTPRTCKRWTDKENKILRKAYTDNTEPNWQYISQLLSYYIGFSGNSRSPEACRKQWERLQSSNVTIQTGSINPGETLMWDGKQQKAVVLPPIPWYKKVDWLGILVLVGAIAILTYFVSSL